LLAGLFGADAFGVSVANDALSSGSKLTSKLMASGSGGGAACHHRKTARCKAALAPAPVQ
jgi:hypothetical protein